MRILIFIFISLFAIDAEAQSKVLLIGRNLASKTLPDSNTIRTFGFAKNLNQNPSVPGPTLYVKEGDSLTIDFWNVSQGAGHTIHLHGLDVDQENDGVPHLSYTVEHMEHGYYRFKAPHPGTYLYHCHVISSIHVQAGMYGMLIVHTKSDSLKTWEGGHSYEREFSILTSEIDTFWHQDTVLEQGHDHMIHSAVIPKYKPQFFLVNGHAYPNATNYELPEFRELNYSFLRIANMGNMANRYYFPRFLNAYIVSSDGRPLPKAYNSDSLWVFPGERYGVILGPSYWKTDSITISYRNMNTLKEEGIAQVKVIVTPDLSIAGSAQQEVRLFPNPGNGLLRYSLPNNYNLSQIEVFDIAGKKQIVLHKDSGEIELRDLPNGLYQIRFFGQNGQTHNSRYLKVE